LLETLRRSSLLNISDKSDLIAETIKKDGADTCGSNSAL
jgi:hypothetical protein